MSKSPIFIVGCPRSGTKLLRDLLRSHPNITFPQESHFVPKLYKAYGNPKNKCEAVKLASTILNLHWVKSWGLALDPDSFSGYRFYHQIVSRIFEEWAQKENKPRWGDKTPQYVTEIPTLFELFPFCKIIHIYRDGRDVALSLVHTRFGPANVFIAATYWKRLVTIGCCLGAALPPENYLEICYEKLLNQPKETMRHICSFLAEPFTEEVLRLNVLQNVGYPSIVGKRKSRYGKRTEIDASNQAKWKIEMSYSDRIIFESVAGDLLMTLGYETEGLRRRFSPLESFIWNAHSFFWFVLNRLNMGWKKRWLLDSLLMQWALIRYRLRSMRLIRNQTGKIGDD